MPNFDGRARTIQRKDLQLPFERDGQWQIAHGLVAGLIFQLGGNYEDFPVLSQRSPELWARADFHILTDAKRSVENGNMLVDHWQK